MGMGRAYVLSAMIVDGVRLPNKRLQRTTASGAAGNGAAHRNGRRGGRR